MKYKYSHFTMSDAFERAYAHDFQAESKPVNIVKSLRTLGRLLRRVFTPLAHSASNVLNAQADARARDLNYSRTPW